MSLPVILVITASCISLENLQPEGVQGREDLPARFPFWHLARDWPVSAPDKKLHWLCPDARQVGVHMKHKLVQEWQVRALHLFKRAMYGRP